MNMQVIQLDDQVLLLLRSSESRINKYGTRVSQIKKELDAKKPAEFVALPESRSADG